MKHTLFLVVALAISTFSNAQQKETATGKWTVDGTHSTVKFTVSHLSVSEVDGRFKVFNGSISANNADFTDAQVSFDAEVASINTDNEKRDEHLKSEDFFNAAKYPKMSFTSTSFKKGKGNEYTLSGNLTIRGVSKPVTFVVHNGGIVKDPYGNIKTGFSATSKISRKSYGLTWSALTEAGGMVVGDKVSITLNLEFSKSK